MSTNTTLHVGYSADAGTKSLPYKGRTPAEKNFLDTWIQSFGENRRVRKIDHTS